MAEDFDQIGNFLSRWSRRKLEQKPSDVATADPVDEAVAEEGGVEKVVQPEVNGAPQAEAVPLPPVEGVSVTSDFAPFMQAKVDAGVKRAALKQLFKDPHFNVMDGLDTYIEDYSIPDPIPDEMMKTLYQARQHLFSPEEREIADAADAAAAEDLRNRLDAANPEQTRDLVTESSAEPGPGLNADAVADPDETAGVRAQAGSVAYPRVRAEDRTLANQTKDA